MKNSDLPITLYETQFRDNLISLLPMGIPLNEQKKWILAGVTLFLRTY